MSDNFEPILRYFRKRGNYLSREDELKVACEQGILDDPQETMAYYKEVAITEAKAGKEDLLNEQSQNNKSSKQVEVDDEITDEIVMHQYKHPVEQFMINQDWQFFYEDFSGQVVELLDHLEGLDKSREIKNLKDQIMSAFNVKMRSSFEKRNQISMIKDAIKQKLTEEIKGILVNFKRRDKYSQATLNDRIQARRQGESEKLMKISLLMMRMELFGQGSDGIKSIAGIIAKQPTLFFEDD